MAKVVESRGIKMLAQQNKHGRDFVLVKMLSRWTHYVAGDEVAFPPSTAADLVAGRAAMLVEQLPVGAMPVESLPHAPAVVRGAIDDAKKLDEEAELASQLSGSEKPKKNKLFGG